jgi:hypothetical protein
MSVNIYRAVFAGLAAFITLSLLILPSHNPVVNFTAPLVVGCLVFGAVRKP